jgi:hypothetical protein
MKLDLEVMSLGNSSSTRVQPHSQSLVVRGAGGGGPVAMHWWQLRWDMQAVGLRVAGGAGC